MIYVLNLGIAETTSLFRDQPMSPNSITNTPMELSPVNGAILNQLLSRSDSSTETIKDFWRFMLLCFNTPRPSTNYDGVDKPERSIPIRRAIEQICKDRGLAYTEDSALNVIVSNNPGKKALVCFQGHMDVVVSKNDSVVHNFETEGVDVRLMSDGTLKPVKGITLGADNGVAIAAGLAILVNHKEVPLELLVTQNEETGFDGARGLDVSKLTSDVLLNLDTEVEDQICVGSAGGFEQRFYIPIETSTTDSKKFSVCLTNFKGGHSGIDIDKEKFNAIIAMQRILLLVNEDIRLVSFNGGTSSNAIPRECSAVVAVKDESVISRLRENFDTLKSEIVLNEPDCQLVISPVTGNEPMKALTVESTQRVLRFLSACPNGIMHRNMQTGDVESSVNIGVVQTGITEFVVKLLARSTSVSWMKYFAKRLTAIGSLANARVEELIGMFGSWEPDVSSGVVKRLISSHPKGIKPKLYSVHAGLEGSTIMERFAEAGRKIECASIGPQIEHAHSPDECLFVESAVNFVNWVESYVRKA